MAGFQTFDRGRISPFADRLFAAIAIALLPVLTLVMVTSLVVGILPISRLRTVILRFQKILVGTVGDSYALLESSIRGSAMSSSVQRDLQWLKKVAAKTVVLAHSQGAAVAHAALRSEGVRPDLLLTFGSGLRKLMVLDRIRDNERYIVWLPPLGLFLVATGSWLGYQLIVDPSTRVDSLAGPGMEVIDHLSQVFGFEVFGWWSFMTIGAIGGVGFGAAAVASGALAGEGLAERVMAIPAVGLIGVAITLFVKTIMFAGPRAYIALVFVIAGIVLLKRGFSVLDVDGSNPSPNDRLELKPSIPWVDLYAKSDPVPNGPPTIVAVNFIDSRPVWNLASQLRDHFSYWQNQDQFVPAVAREIATVAGISLTASREWDHDYLQRAGNRRRWRVGWLAATRALALFAGIVLTLRFLKGPWHQPTDLPGALGTVFLEFIGLVQRIPFLKLLLTDWTKSALAQALWPLLLLVYLWLTRRLVLSVWYWWDRHDTQALFGRKNFTLLPIPFITLLTVVGVVVALSITSIIFLDSHLAVLSTQSPGIRAMGSDFWNALNHPSPQGVAGGIFLALVPSVWAASIAMFVRSRQAWWSRAPDSLSPLGYVLVALMFAAPVVWYLFNHGIASHTPQSLMSGWSGLAAIVGLSAFSLLAIVVVSAVVDSRIGRHSVNRLYDYSASGALGSWLARPDVRLSAIGNVLAARRADQMLAEPSAWQGNTAAKPSR